MLYAVSDKSLIFGLLFFVTGLWYLKSGFSAINQGKIPANKSRTKWFFKDTQPEKFWAECATHLLGGLGLLGFCIYVICFDFFGK